MPPEGGEIVVKVCPLCKTPIATTLRYMNIVKETYCHIMNIKRKVFGNNRTLEMERATLMGKFSELHQKYGKIIQATRSKYVPVHIIIAIILVFQKCNLTFYKPFLSYSG